MAFSVTPTSGDFPYNFTATFLSAMLLDDVRYSLLFQSSTAVGSCPSLGVGTELPGGVASLLATGTYTSTISVPAGSCRAYTLRIRDNVTDTFISTETVHVDNIE